MAALYPPFFRKLAMAAGVPSHQATAYWGYTTSAALLLIALIAPILGAVSDITGGKKRFLAAFAGLGILATAGFSMLGQESWQWGTALFIAANIGFAGSIIFYESLLPHIAGPGRIDQVSTRGYAWGYAGGGLLLVVHVLWVSHPGWFGLRDAGMAVRAAFVSVALWWGLFSLPLWRSVPEPPAAVASGSRRRPVRMGVVRLARTFGEIRRYRQLTLFLVAYWCYSDGIGTIIKMATAYGDEIGIGQTDMIMALIITQFVGVPCSFVFGGLARRIGAKRGVLLALGVYMLISVAGYFMRTAAHFYLLAFLVGTVQGGSQALSRSLFGIMVPRHKSAEFFGFFSTSAKFAGIAGPLLFGVVSQTFGHSRLSILALIVFFVVGGLLLSRVNVQEAARIARQIEEDAGVAAFNHPG
jgi:UMF1 family MFS transporter